MGYTFAKPVGGFLEHEGDIDLMVTKVEVDPQHGTPVLVKVSFMAPNGDTLNNRYDLTNRGAQFAFAALLGGVYPEVEAGEEYNWSPETMVGKFVAAATKMVEYNDKMYCNLARIYGAAAPFADPTAPRGTSLI